LGGAIAGKHLDFTPRLAEARWLSRHFDIHALIDLSDGLAGDLRHLLHASGVGAGLLSEAIPISRVARERAARDPAEKRPLLAALTDGEDFELLFTVASRDAVPLLDAWRRQFPEVRLSCVGKVTTELGVRLRDRRGPQPFPHHGYVHFAQS
jgi:thiamine-monophosphate kinase